MNNVITGSFAQKTFLSKFLSTGNAPSIIDSIVSGYVNRDGSLSDENGLTYQYRFFGFALIGAIIQAPISNRWGRRAATGVAAVLLVISGALQAGSVHIAMFLVAVSARIMTYCDLQD